MELVLEAADLFRSILGDGYDLVGFDPRGESILRWLVPRT